MKKIEHRGNLPPILALFAKQLGGVYANVKQTEFWEMESIKEMESKAVDIGFELVPSLDTQTNRGFLVGFDAADSVIVSPAGGEYSQLKMYFIEITSEQLKEWDKKIKEHRRLQLEDMQARQELRMKSQTKKLEVKKND